LPEHRPVSLPDEIPGVNWEENEARILALVELVATGEAVALVGAGVSARAGYDSWPDLLDKLEGRANEIRPGFIRPKTTGDSREYLAIAQSVRDHISGAGSRQVWHDEMGRAFYRNRETIVGSLGTLHRELVRLPFRSFVTTNVEAVLEIALEEFQSVKGRVESVAVWNGNDSRLLSPAIRGIASSNAAVTYVLHLHGVYWSGRSLILCADEYAEAYGIPLLAALGPKAANGELPLPPPQPPPQHLLLLTTSLLATRRIVFVGFSLDDVYFTEVLRRVSDMLWEWDTATHFAVMPIDASRASEQLRRAAELKVRLGIVTVFYPVIDGSYAALDSLISSVAREVEDRRAPIVSPDAATSVASTAVALPDWVHRNNVEQLARLQHDED
jgi:hypothetical protein